MFPDLRGAFVLQHGVSSAEARINDIADDIMLSVHLSKQSRSSHIQYERFFWLITKNAEVFPLLESLNEKHVDEKKGQITYVDRDMLHATQASFVVLLIDVANFYISFPT